MSVDEKKLEIALKTIKRLEYVISVLRTSLLRLKNRRDWKDVGEVDSYIDKMLSLM